MHYDMDTKIIPYLISFHVVVYIVIGWPENHQGTVLKD